MTAIRIIDDHVQLASIGTKTHAAIEGHIQGIGNYAFPAADGGADQVLKTNGAGVLAWIDKNHSIASHNDTSATGAQLDTLVDNSIADALHRHSELVASDGSPDPALSVNPLGSVDIGISGAGDRTLKIHSDTVGAYVAMISAGNYGGWYNYGSTLMTLYQAADGDMLFYTNGVERMRIKNRNSIGIGTGSPVTSALLELSSTTGALLLTRMTTIQRDALTAVNGMFIYNSTLNKFQGYENGAWVSFI